MAIFRYRLATMLRLRENERDRCRQELAEARRDEQRAAARVIQLKDELSALRTRVLQVTRPGVIDVERLRNAQRYEQQLRVDLRQAEANHQATAAEAERRRQTLVEADREVQMLEKHREQQLARHRATEHRMEIKQLDEQTIVRRASNSSAKLRQLS